MDVQTSKPLLPQARILWPITRALCLLCKIRYNGVEHFRAEPMPKIKRPHPELWLISPEEFAALRHSCFMSRKACANFLRVSPATVRVSPATVRAWERGRTRPNWAAVRLLRLYRLGDLGALHDTWRGWILSPQHSGRPTTVVSTSRPYGSGGSPPNKRASGEVNTIFECLGSTRCSTTSHTVP